MAHKKNLCFSRWDVERLQRCRRYIDDHYARSQTIKSLSRQVGLNEQKLKAGFRLLYATTIHQYIMQRRLQAALHLLQTTDAPVKSIAAQVGYRPRNFYQAFKRYYGRSPHACRSGQPGT